MLTYSKNVDDREDESFLFLLNIAPSLGALPNEWPYRTRVNVSFTVVWLKYFWRINWLRKLGTTEPVSGTFFNQCLFSKPYNNSPGQGVYGEWIRSVSIYILHLILLRGFNAEFHSDKLDLHDTLMALLIFTMFGTTAKTSLWFECLRKCLGFMTPSFVYTFCIYLVNG